MGGHLLIQPIVEALRLRLEKEDAPEDLLEDVWLAELSQLMPELRARYPDLSPRMAGDTRIVRARLFAAVATLDGVNAWRPLAINTGTVTVQNVTIRNGFAPFGRAIFSSGVAPAQPTSWSDLTEKFGAVNESPCCFQKRHPVYSSILPWRWRFAMTGRPAGPTSGWTIFSS